MSHNRLSLLQHFGDFLLLAELDPMMEKSTCPGWLFVFVPFFVHLDQVVRLYCIQVSLGEEFIQSFSLTLFELFGVFQK